MSIWQACKQGDALYVKATMDHFPHMIFVEQNGKSPLFMAATHGHFSCVQLLLRGGAMDVDGSVYSNTNSSDICNLLRQYEMVEATMNNEYYNLLTPKIMSEADASSSNTTTKVHNLSEFVTTSDEEDDDDTATKEEDDDSVWSGSEESYETDKEEEEEVTICSSKNNNNKNELLTTKKDHQPNMTPNRFFPSWASISPKKKNTTTKEAVTLTLVEKSPAATAATVNKKDDLYCPTRVPTAITTLPSYDEDDDEEEDSSCMFPESMVNQSRSTCDWSSLAPLPFETVQQRTLADDDSFPSDEEGDDNDFDESQDHHDDGESRSAVNNQRETRVDLGSSGIVAENKEVTLENFEQQTSRRLVVSRVPQSRLLEIDNESNNVLFNESYSHISLTSDVDFSSSFYSSPPPPALSLEVDHEANHVHPSGADASFQTTTTNTTDDDTYSYYSTDGSYNSEDDASKDTYETESVSDQEEEETLERQLQRPPTFCGLIICP